MAEQIFFEDKQVKVTNSRLIINTETYVLANITSVKTGHQPGKKAPKPETKTVSLVILGIITLFFCVVAIASGLIGFFIAGGIIAIAWRVARSIMNDQGEKDKYSLIIRTSGAEIKALESKNEDYINMISAAVNSAIVSA